MAEKTYKIVENNRQLKVTLPRVLCQAVGMKPNDKVYWLVDKGELILRKV